MHGATVWLPSSSLLPLTDILQTSLVNNELGSAVSFARLTALAPHTALAL